MSFFPVGKKEEEADQWFEVFHELLSGYQMISRLSNDEWNAIPFLCVYIELLWIVFDAMRNGSSNYLPQNGLWTYDHRCKLLFSK